MSGVRSFSRHKRRRRYQRRYRCRLHFSHTRARLRRAKRRIMDSAATRSQRATARTTAGKTLSTTGTSTETTTGWCANPKLARAYTARPRAKSSPEPFGSPANRVARTRGVDTASPETRPPSGRSRPIVCSLESYICRARAAFSTVIAGGVRPTPVGAGGAEPGPGPLRDQGPARTRPRHRSRRRSACRPVWTCRALGRSTAGRPGAAPARP